ncbi:MAG: hypothetical protein K9H62_13570 [Bacteroidales bacterium]|nr:hypothetical protein [Bacteroidales bacterium]
MKKLKIMVLVLIAVSCSTNNQDKTIAIFTDTFGEEYTAIFDEIVQTGETMLINAYKTNSTNEAYQLFLSDVASIEIDSLNIGLSEVEINSFVNLFEKDNLKYRIWNFSKRNGIDVFGFDMQGLFMKAIMTLIPTNKAASEFYKSYNVAGQVPYSLFAQGIFNRYSEFDDYILKRIVIVDILYRHCTLRQLYKAKIKPITK